MSRRAAVSRTTKPEIGESRRILDAFRRVVQAIQTSSRALERDLGITGAQLFVLAKVKETADGSINELAERTLTHQSSVSVVVDRLVRKRLVSKRADPYDRRRVVVRVTARGENVLRQAPSTLQDRLAKGLFALCSRKRRALDEILAELMASAGLTVRVPVLFLEPEDIPARKKAHRA